jgi:hypothetical protein
MAPMMPDEAPTKGRLALERQYDEGVVALKRDNPQNMWLRLKDKKLKKHYQALAIRDHTREIHEQLEEVTLLFHSYLHAYICSMVIPSASKTALATRRKEGLRDAG